MSEIFPETLDFWTNPAGDLCCIMKTHKRIFGGRKYDLLVRIQDGWYLEMTITDKDFYELAYKYAGHLDIKNLFEIGSKVWNSTREDCHTLAQKLLQVKPELREWLEVNFKEYL